MNIEDIKKLGKKHKGFRHERTKFKGHGEIEKAFYEHWRKQNVGVRGINHGYGTLQDLLIDEDFNSPLKPSWFVTKINSRDRFIVATVMQWLGTNCGFCFLQEVLKSCGYSIVKDKTQPSNSD